MRTAVDVQGGVDAGQRTPGEPVLPVQRNCPLEPAPGGPAASDHSRRCSSVRFHGNQRSTSAGAFPPAAAHSFKYALSHNSVFSPFNANVCTTENSIAASSPLHLAPDPQ